MCVPFVAHIFGDGRITQFAFEVIEVSFTGWRRFSESKAGGKFQGQRSLCSLTLLKAICCLEVLQAPYRCRQFCSLFWSTVCHKEQAMYEKPKREQMREQENIERHQPLVLNGVTLKLQSVPIKIKPSDKPVTIPKVPVLHCDACLGDWQLICSLQEVTRQLRVTKVLNLFLDHAILFSTYIEAIT